LRHSRVSSSEEQDPARRRAAASLMLGLDTDLLSACTE
jgi:hypothetical protein